MLEAARRPRIAEAHLVQQGAQDGRRSARHMPERIGVDAVVDGEHAHALRRIVARVEAEGKHLEAFASQRLARFRDGVLQRFGARRTNRAATRIDEAQHQRSALQPRQRERGSVGAQQAMVARGVADCRLACRQRLGGVDAGRHGGRACKQGGRDESDGQASQARHARCHGAHPASAERKMPVTSSRSCTSEARKFAMAALREGAR